MERQITHRGLSYAQVVELARRFFDLKLGGRIFAMDAAVAVQQLLRERQDAVDAEQDTRAIASDPPRRSVGVVPMASAGYDYILHDIFSGAKASVL